MNGYRIYLVVGLCLFNALCHASTIVATNCAQMAAILRDYKLPQTSFTVTAHVLPHTSESALRHTPLVTDGSGTVSILMDDSIKGFPLAAGDIVRLHGKIHRDPADIYFICTNCEHVCAGPAEGIPTVTGVDILSGAYDNRPLRLRGTVQNVWIDENNPQFLYFLVKDGETFLYAASLRSSSLTEATTRILGADVELLCHCQPYIHSNRRQIGRVLQCGQETNIRILSKSKTDPFAVDDVDDLRAESPSRLPLSGRRRIVGRVEATWGKTHLIVRPSNGFVSNITLSDTSDLPTVGTCVEVSGYPETDLYRINLTQAIWRPALLALPPPDPPEAVTARRLLGSGREHLGSDPTLHGARVSLEGLVRTVVRASETETRFTLESDGELFPVCLSPAVRLSDDLENGCRVRLTGVFIMEIESWRPTQVFPRMHGAFLVLTASDDLSILVHPPWWTPIRFILVILTLLVLLFAAAALVFLLNRLALKRGRQLADEQVARVSSELKVMERTRLAVELHDSIAQNLTGVALEIQAINTLLHTAPDAAEAHLKIADTSLRSSREELRNCLRDLRSDALDINDMNTAIRHTLGTQTGKTKILIRFNIPRERFSDNTAHTILRIIRELTLNAIRHGRATEVRIAGTDENGELRFSVTDNGRGFDVTNHPGVREGHFGLQGIRERVASLNGTIQIHSAPDCGTRVTVALQLPQEIP